jgi:UDP-2,4-diacetamido-2,4,6-trideoxy-beta-L-altropyranose hydrolase
LRIAIRADASATIGSGHVARCLTLARALRERGAEVVFLTRAFANGGLAAIRTAGFAAIPLPVRDGYADSWLGASLEDELADVRRALAPGAPWHRVVVDHYSLGARWERSARAFADGIFAIDDLADRDHACDVLLDQNRLSGGEAAYRPRVPAGTTLLLGPRYALLRDEFGPQNARLRDGRCAKLFVFFGGVDAPNMTARALDALESLAWDDLSADVVIGAANPHAQAIAARADARIRVHAATDAIASLMMRADLAIGAGGTTSWERAALGLASLVAAIAPNQVTLVRDLAAAGVVRDMGVAAMTDPAAIARALADLRAQPAALAEMSRRALEVMHGSSGAAAVADAILEPVAV